jgi:hypothetical protein
VKIMMDDEVWRLRRLQSSALRVIAIDEALVVDEGGSRAKVMPLPGVVARRVARIVRECLQRHPNLRFRRGAGRWERGNNALAALHAKFLQSRKGGAQRIMLEALARMSRQVDDVRALTWSQDLSDRLARIQVELRAVSISLRVLAETLDAASKAGLTRAADGDRLPGEAPAREASG